MPWTGRVAESPRRPSQLPAALRSAECPSPGRAAPAGTSRHQPAAGGVTAGRRHAAEEQEHADDDERVRRRRARTSPQPSAPNRVRARCVRRSGRPPSPSAMSVTTMPKLGSDDIRPAWARSQAAFGVQGGDHEGDAVDEHVGEQGRGQRDRQHRPSARGADRVVGHGQPWHRARTSISRCRISYLNIMRRRASYDETAHDPRSADTGPDGRRA